MDINVRFQIDCSPVFATLVSGLLKHVQVGQPSEHVKDPKDGQSGVHTPEVKKQDVQPSTDAHAQEVKKQDVQPSTDAPAQEVNEQEEHTVTKITDVMLRQAVADARMRNKAVKEDPALFEAFNTKVASKLSELGAKNIPTLPLDKRECFMEFMNALNINPDDCPF